MYTEDVLRELIAQTIQAIDINGVDSDKSFNDIGMDSLDQSAFLLAIEEQHHVKIPDEDIDYCYSIKSTLDYLNSKKIEA